MARTADILLLSCALTGMNLHGREKKSIFGKVYIA